MLTEALLHFKTILTYCNEDQIISKYSRKLDEIQEKQNSKKITSGIFFGLSFFILFMTYGLIFYLSSIFIRDNNLQITDAFSAVFLVLFSGIIAGNNVKSMPDLGMLKITAEKLFKLIDL
jgi:ATP-binding cassette subfamily B (MDR/TAP) protein 1